MLKPGITEVIAFSQLLLTAGTVFLMLFLLHIIDKRFSELGTKIDRGFSGPKGSIRGEQSHSNPGNPLPSNNPSEERLKTKPVKPSGVGAIVGAVSGSAMGLVFGPIGIFIGGVSGAILGNYAEYKVRLREEGVSRGDVEEAVEMLYRKMVKAGFTPDYIVAIDGGGYLVGAAMAEKFRKEMRLLKVTGRPVKREVDSAALDRLGIEPGQKVLLVDDQATTGQTLITARKAIKERYEPLEVRTAVLARRLDSYYQRGGWEPRQIIDFEAWVTAEEARFPWVGWWQH